MLFVFEIKKGNNFNGRPDNYPFTGSGKTCGYCVSLITWERIEELTTGVFIPVVRTFLLTNVPGVGGGV